MITVAVGRLNVTFVVDPVVTDTVCGVASVPDIDASTVYPAPEGTFEKETCPEELVVPVTGGSEYGPPLRVTVAPGAGPPQFTVTSTSPEGQAAIVSVNVVLSTVG
jgi:hypothetical protein